MIRIDEIYSHTFRPFIKQNIPLTRMFFCDPPGTTSPENLYNYGDSRRDLNYIFFHDQEPIILELHRPLFDDVRHRNHDLRFGRGPKRQSIIVSEQDSKELGTVCDIYNWKSYYYFFHGWAALDWYRGYDKTFLIDPPEKRTITHSFISPNRIIGGKREHRVWLMYYILKNKIQNAHLSFPKMCPGEQQDILEIVAQHLDQYPDIIDVFSQADLPKNFPGETDHPMHSCWLSLFVLCQQSLCYIVTKTVFSGNRKHLTEKIFKPICLQMPFILVGAPNNLAYLKSYGFRTFDHVWDESYDLETNEHRRIKKIADLITNLSSLDSKGLNDLYQECLPVIKHNYQHFYNGNFEGLLWKELTNTLNQLKYDHT